MEREHQIVQEVYAAKKDADEEERLILRYLPFIKSEASKNTHKAAGEAEDEVSIAMFAFHEAVKGYRKEKGAFLTYAAMVIRSRIVDYYRKEKKYGEHLYLQESTLEKYGKKTVLERTAPERNEVEEYGMRLAAKEEIAAFCRELAGYSLSLGEIAESCPKQERNLKACHAALNYAKQQPDIMENFCKSKRLPLKQLASGAGVKRKTLERHRKYLAALLLAYTNGFEIIRGHLSQIVPKEGRDGT